ncbi:hypothetical protein N7462_006413 [Penicillium macrosclerotiorum]|uniref:uncharacterized protein n=1 Tax=Penicillium macrosclerotiorum TaxID=303699 RepID=UPI002546C3B3|nr:uncharacterized protein N7462_006413 [Penicillium macrosclerotiorum]KAJ5683248.1 hypothetical protein N7462_006413 [Penicillium macrosclerotiorum]
MMSKLKEKLAGPGYVILNAIRALNIIVFLDIIAASVVMLIKTNTRNGFFFFQAVTHAIVALISIALIISELPFFPSYFNRRWPMFGEDAGFIALAAIMMILGVSVLGNLNMAAMSQKSLGMSFWQIVISAGILAMVMSVVNLLATFIFSYHTDGGAISARHVRQYGAQAPKELREDSLPSYTQQQSQNPLKRMTKRFSRFPLKISSPINHNNGNSNLDPNAHANVNDAASSYYSHEVILVYRLPPWLETRKTHPPGVCKSLWPLPSPFTVLTPFVTRVRFLLILVAARGLPRLLSTISGARKSVTSAPRRPVPAAAGRALNLLFASVVFFLLLSLPFGPQASEPNIFALTRSRIHTPADVIFNRLAKLRPGEVLTDADGLLKDKLTSLGSRKVYLTFGPDALVSCQWCSLGSLRTYLLYYLPFHVFLPHLGHLLILGTATSSEIAGRECARWRIQFILAGMALMALDLCVVISYDAVSPPAVRDGLVPPMSLYDRLTRARWLVFMLCDAICAAIIYLSSTNRLFYKPPPPLEQLDQGMRAVLARSISINEKLQVASVTRNAVLRDRQLKARDDLYWQTVAAMENPTRRGDVGAEIHATGGYDMTNNIWEDEEVARAISQAIAGEGSINTAQLGLKARQFVRGVTEGLD